MPEPGGPLALPIFGISVNPIPTGKGRLSPLITTGTPNVFHLLASLEYSEPILLHTSFFVITQLTLDTIIWENLQHLQYGDLSNLWVCIKKIFELLLFFILIGKLYNWH